MTEHDATVMLCFTFIAFAAILAVTIYSVVKLLTTGRALVERQEDRPGKLHVVER